MRPHLLSDQYRQLLLDTIFPRRRIGGRIRSNSELSKRERLMLMKDIIPDVFFIL